jgi:ubiquitin-conjugating enzyme E2 W
MKRLVQIVVPSFGGEKGPHPGVVKRVKRFIVALLGLERQVASKSSDKDADEKSHLEAHFKPGQLNYRIQKELKEFMKNPPDGCSVDVGKNIRVSITFEFTTLHTLTYGNPPTLPLLKIWIVTITGAKGSVFEGEKFRLRVSFPTDYPTRPPSVYFLQSPPPPRHEHVYTNGDICLSLLGKDWKPTLTISGLALSIVSMLASASEKRLPQDNAARKLHILDHLRAPPNPLRPLMCAHRDCPIQMPTLNPGKPRTTGSITTIEHNRKYF